MKFLICTYFSLLTGVAYGIDVTNLQKLLVATSKPSEATSYSSYVVPVERLLTTLPKERADIDQLYRVSDLLAATSAELKELTASLEAAPKDFLQRKLSLVRQRYLVLTDIDQIKEQITEAIDTHTQLLTEYKQDSLFRKQLVETKAAYTYEDLEQLSQRILEHSQQLISLEKTRLTTLSDITKRKKNASLMSEELRQRKAEQEEFVSLRKDQSTGYLLDEQVKLGEQRKTLADIKVAESNIRLELINSQLAIERAKYTVLKQEYAKVRRSLRINQATVQQRKQKLEEDRKEYLENREQLLEKIRVIEQFKSEVSQQITDLTQEYHVPETDELALKMWSKDPKSRRDWRISIQLGSLYNQYTLLECEREYIESQIAVAKIQLRSTEIDFNMLQTWYRITQRSFGSEFGSQYQDELKFYEAIRAELQAELTVAQEKHDRVVAQWPQLNALRDRITSQQNVLKKNQSTQWVDHEDEWQLLTRNIRECADKVRNRLDISAQLAEKYMAIIALIKDTQQKSGLVIDEISSLGFWRRSYHSIDWSDLKQFFPDVRRFMTTFAQVTQQLWLQFSPIELLRWLRAHTFSLLLFAIFLLISTLLWFLIRWLLAQATRLLPVAITGRNWHNVASLWLRLLLAFCTQHARSLYFFALCLFLALQGIFYQAYGIVLLLFALIPYSAYLIASFGLFLRRINAQLNYILVAKIHEEYIERVAVPFAIIMSGLLCFREAFMFGDYTHSPVPMLLIAAVVILAQIALISLLSKSYMLSIIPTTTPLWEWFHERVERYFYLWWFIFATIIIMSNPYVGYGYQVLYIILRLIGSGVIGLSIFWLHGRLRTIASDLFFYYEEGETVKERFTAGKTWYGFFVVGSLVLALVAGAFLVAFLWGRSLTFADAYRWLTYAWYTPTDETGKIIEVSTLSLFQIVLFVSGGLLLNYVINQFILKRVFDPLLVGAGVQNAMLSLTKYIILFLAIFMGLSSAGLDGLATKFALLMAGLSFAVSEPVRDFFSYFIILIQRPIKIGDFIRIDDEVMGVVRHITPRSVVIRRRNSVTIVVPNSYFIMRPIVNWNFSRNFFAFEDIMMTIPFSADPHRVRSIIFKVLQTNPDVLRNPAPIVWLNSFVDNGYQFLIRGYLTADKVLDQWEISSQVRLELVRALRTEGIQIASPVRMVHMLSDIKQPEMAP